MHYIQASGDIEFGYNCVRWFRDFVLTVNHTEKHCDFSSCPSVLDK